MFVDREDAGRRLARRLGRFRGPATVVLGLPRGGVPVAFEVARALGAPLDVMVVHKIGMPGRPELAMGAVAEGGGVVLNQDVIRRSGVSAETLRALANDERAVVEDRVDRYRTGRPATSLRGRTVLIVDDGVATGATARAACRAAHAQGAARVVLAVPVAPPGVEQRFLHDADEVVCVEEPPGFAAVGQFYEDFDQVPDAEVTTLLSRAAGHRAEAPTGGEFRIGVPGAELSGILTVPPDARGTVVFAHGSGSSRLSPRNRYVASVLSEAGLATLLFDLLEPAEEHDRRLVFDIPFLAGRLAAATAWLADEPQVGRLPVGWFGASTGAAAALWAAAEPTCEVMAVVSRGGRPDLAGARLGLVRAPTLLVVGGDDVEVLELNRRARAALRCESRLSVVPGATHLFEEPGTLERAAALARDWFVEHLSSVRQP
jgi:predicted phosphoribosyltransferase/dienelactone hydrolase